MTEPELPAYVTWTTEAIDKLSQSFQQALNQLATKDQLENVRMQLRHEREARERLEADLERDEQARNTKMTRLWAGVWSVAAVVGGVIVTNLLTVLHL